MTVQLQGRSPDAEKLVRFYLKHLRYLNNWDLIDVTAPRVLGPYYFARSRKPLYAWVKSHSMWERRIAIMTTQEFIRQGDCDDTLELCRLVLGDSEDLIHKASGWMLRCVGDQRRALLLKFIRQWGHQMPRTMLRYAIEHLPVTERQRILRSTSAKVAKAQNKIFLD